jgi:DNA-binding MarR family transcriptional regulator
LGIQIGQGTGMTMDRRLPPYFHAGIRDRLVAAGRGPEAAEALITLDSAMFVWYRVVSQGQFTAPILDDVGAPLELSQFRALTAVTRIAEGIGREAPAAPTIGALAEELALDPSRASRVAADLIAAGYLRREAAQEDGRKSVLSLTDKAVAVFGAYRDNKWDRYVTVFDGWSDAEIETFAALFARFFDGMSGAYGLIPPQGGTKGN